MARWQMARSAIELDHVSQNLDKKNNKPDPFVWYLSVKVSTIQFTA